MDAVSDRRGPVLTNLPDCRVIEAWAAWCDAGQSTQCDGTHLRIALLRRQTVFGNGCINLTELEQRLGEIAARTGGIRALRQHAAQRRDRIAIRELRRAGAAETVPRLQQRGVGTQCTTIRGDSSLVVSALVELVSFVQCGACVHGQSRPNQAISANTSSICRPTSSMSAMPSTECSRPCAA